MNPSKSEKRLIAGIRGWLHNREATFLFQLASTVSGGLPIVEIGSFRGKSTIAIALGSKHGGNSPVYAVDPQLPFVDAAGEKFDGPKDKSQFFRNVTETGVGDLVYVVNLSSAQTAAIWDRELGMVFIDGDHREVSNDFRLWDSHLGVRGLMVFHDTTWAEIGKTARDIEESVAYERAGKVRSTLALRKVNGG